jgi:hypothetical protein
MSVVGPFQHKNDMDNNYQYNGDLCVMYSHVDVLDRDVNTRQAIERISARYRPNITVGFELDQIELIRTLGRGMTGSVSDASTNVRAHARRAIRRVSSTAGLSGEMPSDTLRHEDATKESSARRPKSIVYQR